MFGKDIKVEHVLMFVIVAFLLYHFMGRCGCGMRSNNGFSVGGKYMRIPETIELPISGTACGYGYDNKKPQTFITCTGLDKQKCLCLDASNSNNVVEADENDFQKCMPDSGNGMGALCYKEKDLTSFQNQYNIIQNLIKYIKSH
jgi:hypothetical protein